MEKDWGFREMIRVNRLLLLVVERCILSGSFIPWRPHHPSPVCPLLLPRRCVAQWLLDGRNVP